MCFSASASFSVASALFVTSLYTIYTARKNPSTRRLAFFPLFFAVQQGCEGIIWMTHHTPSWVTTMAMYSYMFFAMMFWPVWISYALLPLEKTQQSKILLYGTLALGAFFSCSSLFLLCVYGAHADIVGHHVQYILDTSTAVKQIYNPAQFVYVCATIVPPLLSRNGIIRFFGILVALSYLVSTYYFLPWFISIWCFSAAIVSIGVITVVTRVKN